MLTDIAEERLASGRLSDRIPGKKYDAYMAYELLKQKPYALFGGRI